MTVEIRELVIKTHIVPADAQVSTDKNLPNMHKLKQQVVAECLKVLEKKPLKSCFER